MAGACGTCTMCCRLLAIPELKKPTNKWCSHCKIGTGCTIYETRPDSCQKYACVWLQSQDQPERMPITMRPDKSKVVITAAIDGKNIVAHCDPGYPTAWQYGPIGSILKKFAETLNVVVNNGHFFQVDKNGHCRQINMSEPDENGVQWFRGYKTEKSDA